MTGSSLTGSSGTGPNEMPIPIKSIAAIIADEMWHPFYVFQYFPIVVWVAGDAYYTLLGVHLPDDLVLHHHQRRGDAQQHEAPGRTLRTSHAWSVAAGHGSSAGQRRAATRQSTRQQACVPGRGSSAR